MGYLINFVQKKFQAEKSVYKDFIELTCPVPNVLKASSRMTMSLSSGADGSLDATMENRKCLAK